MKAFFGVDSKTMQIHSVAAKAAKAAKAANVHDSQVLEDLLHGYETGVWVIQLTRDSKRSSKIRLQARRASRIKRAIAITT